MPQKTITSLAQSIIAKAQTKTQTNAQTNSGGFMLATAESCTGGMVAAALTDCPGASAAMDCGFITYSNQAKIHGLDVPPATIDTHGAVSHQTVAAMAEAAAKRINHKNGIAVAVSGIAGPSGGTKEKPVGLVCFGLSIRRNAQHTLTTTHQAQFNGTRDQIRRQATLFALNLIDQALDDING